MAGRKGQTYCLTHPNNLSNKMDNSLLAVRDINHKYIVVGKEVIMREIVLYYSPRQMSHTPLLKGILAQMGVRIKNLTPDRCGKKIGFLADLEGYEDLSETDKVQEISGMEKRAVSQEVPMTEELMILGGFTDERLDELLDRLKNTGVPKIRLKAIVTETNAKWTVYELYRQLLNEAL